MIGNIKRRRDIWNGEEKLEEVEESLLRKKIQIEDRYLKSSRQFWQTNLSSLNTNHFQGEQQIDLNAYSQDNRDEMEMEIQCKPKIEFQGNKLEESSSKSEYDQSDLHQRFPENKNHNTLAKSSINSYKQQLEYSPSQFQESFSCSTRADENEFDSPRKQQLKGRMQDSMFSKAEETDSIDQLLLISRAQTTQGSICSSSSQQGINNSSSSFQLNPTQPGWQFVPKSYKDAVTDQSEYTFTGTPNILLQEQSIMEGGVLEKLLSNFSLGEQQQQPADNADELSELTEFLGMLNENFKNVVNQGEFLVLSERSLFGQDFDSGNSNNNTMLNSFSLSTTTTTGNPSGAHTYTLQELRVSDSTYGFITDLQFIKTSGHLSSSTSPELTQLQQRARAEQLAVYADQGSKVIYMAQSDPVSIEELGSLRIAKLGVIAAVLPDHLKLSRPASINTQQFYHAQLKLSATLTHTHTHAFISNYIPLHSVDHEGNNLIEDIYNTNINQMECIRAIDERELSGLRWQHLVFLRIIEAVLTNVVALQRALDPQIEYTKAGTALDLRQSFETKYCRHRSVQMKLCESQPGALSAKEIRLHFCREMQNNRKIECLICQNKTKNFCVQCSEKQQTMVGFCGHSQCFEKHNQVPAMLLNEQSYQIENIKLNQKFLHEQANSFAPAAQGGFNQSGKRGNSFRESGMQKGADGYVSEALASIISRRNQSDQRMASGSALLSRRQLEMSQHPERHQNQSQISSLSKRPPQHPPGKFAYRNDPDHSQQSYSTVQQKRSQLGSSSGSVSGNTSQISQAYQQRWGNTAKIGSQVSSSPGMNGSNSAGLSQSQRLTGQQQSKSQQQASSQSTQQQAQPLQAQSLNKQSLSVVSSGQLGKQPPLKQTTTEQPQETSLQQQQSSSQAVAAVKPSSSALLLTTPSSQLPQSNPQPLKQSLPSSTLSLISKTQLAGPIPPPLLPSQVPLANSDNYQPATSYQHQLNQYKKCKQLREVGESSEFLDESIVEIEEEEEDIEKEKRTKFIEAQRLQKEGRRKGCKILWFQLQDESEAADHVDRIKNDRLSCNILSNPKLRHISIIKPDSNNPEEDGGANYQDPSKKAGVQFIESAGNNQDEEEEIYQYDEGSKQQDKQQELHEKKKQKLTEADIQREKLRIQPTVASSSLFEEDDEEQLINMLSTPAEKAAQKLSHQNMTKSMQQTNNTQEDKDQENNSLSLNAGDGSLSKPTRQVIKSYFAKNQLKN